MVLYLSGTGLNSCSTPGIWLQNSDICPFCFFPPCLHDVGVPCLCRNLQELSGRIFRELSTGTGYPEQSPCSAFRKTWLEPRIHFLSDQACTCYHRRTWQYLNKVRTERLVDRTGAWQKHRVEQFGNFAYRDALLELWAWTFTSTNCCCLYC